MDLDMGMDTPFGVDWSSSMDLELDCDMGMGKSIDTKTQTGALIRTGAQVLVGTLV